ncbi:L,D-transpeptidase family protein [Salipaludibacillus daqingensis]|uniref:L,D-transpeptidase family protein n=1 Tax=Salipaludibacillus daqingensis TaxID=3041001 RepID=UPI003CC873DB
MFKKGLCSVLLVLFFGSMMPVGEVSASNEQLIIINKANNNLIFYENNRAVELFYVATGRDQSLTPEGQFNIVNKIKNRPYYKEDIPGGDPSNPLGNRWLGLDANGTHGNTYAIHGNNNPSSIGTYASAGCVRMYDEQVEWLFDTVEVDTPVLIVTSELSFDSIAEENGFNVEGAHIEATPIVSSDILRYGNIGESVEKLQNKLKKLGYHMEDAIGSYGEDTKEVVKQFQTDNNLEIDGIAGKETETLLEKRNKRADAPLYIPSRTDYINGKESYLVTRTKTDYKIKNY